MEYVYIYIYFTCLRVEENKEIKKIKNNDWLLSR